MPTRITQILCLGLTLSLTACVGTVGWDNFSSRNLSADFFLTSMNDREHIIVLSTDGSAMNGTVVVSGSVISVGNNDEFIIAKQCCNSTMNNDTSYYIVDIREYEHKNWFQRKILSDNNHKYQIYSYPDSLRFRQGLDSLQINGDIKMEEVLTKQ